MMRASLRWIVALALLLGMPGRATAQTVANPHGPAIGACATCHRPDGWKPVRIASSFRHAERTFPLDGAHQTASCASCHTSLDFTKAKATCASCHQDVHRSELGTDCARCHTTRSFVDQARLSRLHEESRFPLRGAHVATACEACHTPTAAGKPQFTNRATTCVSCHRADYDVATTPKHAAAGFPTDCTTCHTETAWRGAPFDHATTQFPLTGAHAASSCTTCHADGVYQGKPTTCVSCHQQDVAATTTPPHAAAGFAATCADCHTTTAWLGTPFDHATTQFPLTGGHQAVTCADCHTDGVYRGKAMACLACHQAEFNQTTTPPHAAAGFATTCATCHNTTRWAGTPFDHGTTRFPLTGGHQATTCADCHADGVYRGKSMTCVSCHRPDYDQTSTPGHAAAGYSTECTTCHTVSAWRGAGFDHNTTQFPLTGGHQAVACATCHADGVFRGKSSECLACHQPDFSGTTNPPHAAAGFPTTCSTCHTTTRWEGAPFNHSTTDFPLTGGHLSASCASCHADGVYNGKPTACVACHRPEYDGTRTPAHAAAGYSTDCSTCHTSTQWLGATFNHATTDFPLTGAHQATSCASCHADGVYNGKPTDCLSCHQADFSGTTNPPHAAAGFPTTCATCHTTTRWDGTPFNHSTTDFPLTGGHLTASCASCHADGVYNGKPTACLSCHQADFSGTTNPPHAAAGFPTACATCHTTTRWDGAPFNHNTTSFPLTGGHLTATCASCHADGVYNGKPTACVACHQPEYNGTTNPPHAAAGYSTQCSTCHTTTQWPGAVFNHSTTQFPLTGAHQAVSCASCHADGVYRGKPTACLSCHQQDYSGTTNPPHAAAGFSTTCTTCHTTTRWTGATFNHSTTQFPLTGAHVATSCTACHSDGVYNGKPTTCVSCHQQDYTTATPNHAAAMFPNTCASCHTTTRWDGATFDHDARWFPIYSGAHRSRWTSCATCHTAPTNFAVFTCTSAGCHSRTETDSDHRGENGYQYVSTACYSCHPRGDH